MVAPRTILVGVDFTELGTLAIDAGARWSGFLHAEGLHLVHVLRGWPWPTPLALGDDLERATARVVEFARADLSAVHVPRVKAAITRRVLVGPIATSIVRAAREAGAELIVAASHGRGPIGRALMGSVTATLIRASHCPVLVVGSDRPGTERPRRVVAAIDLSAIAERVLKEAAAIAVATGAELHVLSAYDMEGGLVARGRDQGPAIADQLPRLYRSAIVEMVHRVIGANTANSIEILARDPPAKLILESTNEHDLIVVGTSGHGVLERVVVGSTATRVLSEAPCPVLVVPLATAENERGALSYGE